MARRRKQAPQIEYVERYGAISKEQRKVRAKARKERERKSFFRILKRKIASPFVSVYRKYETKKFIISKSSRRIALNLGEREKVISAKAARIVAGVDKKNDNRVRVTRKKFERIQSEIENFDFLKGAKRRQMVGATLTMLISGMLIIGVFNVVTAYEYSYKGRVLGMVEETQDVTEIMGVVNSQLTKEHEANVTLSAEDGTGIEFRRVFALGGHMQEADEILTTLTYMQDITVSGYGIFIDGKRTSVVGTEKEAEDILDEILAEYSKPTPGVDYESVEFVEKIQIKGTDVKLGSVEGKQQAKVDIMEGLEIEQGHVVEKGETMNSIANQYGITTEEIEVANLDADKEGLVLGDTLNIITKEPLIHVEVVANVVSTRDIPFETEKVEDSSLFLDTERVSQEGQVGQEEIEAKITYVNGEIVDEKIYSQVITQDPINEKVLVGTKALPPSVSLGTFINPYAAGYLSSPYGMRRGAMHTGVDLAGNMGDPIIASDGGTVTFSGYDGAYGYKIEIYHGDGHETVYAHCSKLLVSVGDSVYQGQHIGNVGSTGRSTGPHVHFEVYLSGTRIDPASVIPI